VPKRALACAAILGLAACYGSHGTTSDDADHDVAADAAHDTTPHDTVDARPDAPDDAAPDAPCVIDPAARTYPGFVVATLEVVRPNVFGSVAPTLTARIDADDIFVLLNADVAGAVSSFHLEVGQGIESRYPTRRGMFCRDDVCGWPPNQVTIYDATLACNDFRTTAPADLVFSLYPPAHSYPGSTVPLRIVNASLAGQFDARRERLDGTLTGGIRADQTPLVYPAFDLSLDELLTAAGVPQDFDADGDGVMDGWQVELRFTAEPIAVEDG
jgi:hypothetical protein